MVAGKKKTRAKVRMMRILAVDDDVTFLEILTELLKSAGYNRVTSCISGSSAMDTISRQADPFDCILLDIDMPERDGIAVCREIRSLTDYKDTPILMVTASKNIEDVDRSFAAGATDFVSKPIDGLELGSRVRVAAMLCEQSRRLAQESCKAAALLARNGAKSAPRFEDEFEIVGVDGCRRFSEVQIDLLKLDSKLYAMNIFAVKVENAEELFEEIGADQFVDVMTAAARSISERLEPFKHVISYTGRGTFGCVQMGRSLDGQVGSKLSESDKSWIIDVTTSSGHPVALELMIGLPVPRNVWTGRLAAEAFVTAVDRVETRFEDILVQRNLDLHRLGERGSSGGRRVELRRFHRRTVATLSGHALSHNE